MASTLRAARRRPDVASTTTSERRGRRRAVHLVGHSLGGVLAHAASVRAPAPVASVATLGSPVRGLRLHPLLRVAATAMRAGIRLSRGRSVPPTCGTFASPSETVRAVAVDPPADIPYVTIATRNDGVADWRYAVGRRVEDVVVVGSSHTGLVFSRAVDRVLARHFAAAAAGRAMASRVSW
jgi:pimeloyl-ACP methyl ester carboxylesterase